MQNELTLDQQIRGEISLDEAHSLAFDAYRNAGDLHWLLRHQPLQSKEARRAYWTAGLVYRRIARQRDTQYFKRRKAKKETQR